MIVYADASAIVKLYVTERGSSDVAELLTRAQIVGTSIISRVEVAAALARATRMGVLSATSGRAAQRAFARGWPDVAKVLVTEALINQAETVAWDHGLRGYDALQLASALTWKEAVGEDVFLATYDHELWDAAEDAGLRRWPEKFPR